MSSELHPLLSEKDSAKRPMFNGQQPGAFQHSLLRDFFTVPTWLSLGAVLQIGLFLLPIKRYYAAAPVATYLAWEITDHLLMLCGLKKDVYAARALRAKYTAVLPNRDGTFTRHGARGDKVCVFFLGFSCNHMLGPMAPGFKEMGEFARKMMVELQEKASETGLLGTNFYFNAGAQKTGSEIMTIFYFRSMADVHAYAEGPLHRAGWEWYNKHTKQYPYLGVMHELYEMPAGKWENVYVNYPPTLLATTVHRVEDEGGNEKWVSPIVDARRGKMSGTHGRLAGKDMD